MPCPSRIARRAGSKALLCYSLPPSERKDHVGAKMKISPNWPIVIAGCVAGLGVCLATVAPTMSGQAKAKDAESKDAAPKKIAIRAGRLIDGKSDTPVTNALILIEGDKIVSVTPGAGSMSVASEEDRCRPP